MTKIRDTGKVIKVYEIDHSNHMAFCPKCGELEDDRVVISANENYTYCFRCSLDWITIGLDWEGSET